MTTFDLASFRSQSRLFQLLDGPGQEKLLAMAKEESFAVDHTLMVEGESGTSFYVVLDGELGVRIDGPNGQKEVAVLKAGAFVGEIAALMDEPRSATVVTKAPTNVLRFDAPPIQHLLAAYPKVREALVKLALKRSEDNLADMMNEE